MAMDVLCNGSSMLLLNPGQDANKEDHRSKKEGKPRIDTSKTYNQDKVEDFARVLEEALPDSAGIAACKRWEYFRDAVFNATMSTFGKKTSRLADWFEAHSEEMTPVIEEKRLSSLPKSAQLTDPSGRPLQSAAERQAMCQQLFVPALLPDTDCSRYRQCKGDLCLHQAGPRPNPEAYRSPFSPLKSATGKVIQDQALQLKRWVEHFSELYARENVVTEDALSAIECLLVLMELDSKATLEEFCEAPDSFASGNRKDGNPAEALKCCKGNLLMELHEILCLCWREGEVPQDMRDANIVMLYKNKGGRGDCNNYCGISLLSIEKCREQKQPLFVAFIDLMKAFDLVSRDGLFKMLHKIGCPPRLLIITRSFQENMKGTVVFDGLTSDTFDIQS
ncbi:uncharacterized protein [Procambarus clarkii]|uniref:uncharacterized protein n=1 Tax=Procambarus clarkii TaxID=6728 RepID=UPI003743AC42